MTLEDTDPDVVAAQSALADSFAEGQLLELLPSLVCVLDRDYRFLYISKGPGREYAIGKPAIDYLPELHRARYRETFDRVWRTGQSDRMLVLDSSDTWWEVTFCPQARDGVTTTMLAMSADVSDRVKAQHELEQSETRLRQAIEATGMGVWTWEHATGRITWDDGMRRILAVSEAESASNASDYYSKVHPDDLARVLENIDHFLATGVYRDIEHRLVRPDGSVRHVLAKGATLRDSRGAAIGLRGGLFDFTERKVMEQQLQQAQKMESLGQLTAGIVHNFNNLLNVILPNVDLLRDLGGPDDQAALKDIRHASQRAAELAQQLMLFARPDSVVKLASVDLRALAKRTISMVRPLFDSRIGIELAAAPEVPNVDANVNQIEQVLLNLYLNARDALEQIEDRPRIQVAIDAVPDGARIRVSDNGPGMTESVRERVFEPFFTTKELGKGTGLGLATVYAIVRDHRGRISCESSVGRGATFEIVLPAKAS